MGEILKFQQNHLLEANHDYSKWWNIFTLKKVDSVHSCGDEKGEEKKLAFKQQHAN